MLAFNSEIEITSETNGNWYIEQLLAKPNVAFRCTHLESLLAGFAEETSTGSIGEVVDMELSEAIEIACRRSTKSFEEATASTIQLAKKSWTKNARPFWIRSSPPKALVGAFARTSMLREVAEDCLQGDLASRRSDREGASELGLHLHKSSISTRGQIQPRRRHRLVVLTSERTLITGIDGVFSRF